MDDLAQAIINLAERVRRLEAQEIPMNSGVPAMSTHDLTGALHIHAGGAALDVAGLTAPNTVGMLTPSSAPGAASAILKSDVGGSLGLVDLGLTGGALVGAATGGNLGAGKVNTSAGYFYNSDAIHPPAMYPSLWLGWYEVNGTDGKLSDAYNSCIESDCTIRQVVWTYFIETTNDVNNYWVVDLRRDDTGASLISWDTSADTFNTKYREFRGYLVALTLAMRGIYIQYSKAGSGAAPGAIHMFPPIIHVEP